MSEESSSAPSRSMLMPLGWVAVAGLVSIAACAGIGLGVNDSESAGVLAAQLSAFPLGFSLSAALAGLIIHFAIQRATTLLRVTGPLGCGCLGGLVTLGVVFGFFVLIFPEL